MAFSQTDLDAIKTAIASGTMKVKYADREVQYQSLDDLLKIKGLIEKELGQAGRKFVYPVHSKGV